MKVAAATLTILLAGTGATNPAPRPPIVKAVVEAPRSTVDTSTIPRAIRRVRVPAGGDLQQALDTARPGDWIELQRGATYTGPFRLRRVEGDGWIVVTTAGALPGPGTRVGPAQAPLMARLRASSGAVVAADEGAHHYRLIGLDIAPAPDTWLVALVQLGGDEPSIDRLPHDIIVDRSYLHGDPRKGSRRGIALNARRAAVVDSYLSDFKEAGADSQAIAGWNGPGPFAITNNYLEAAGENVMFGGADPAIDGLVPSDIVLTRNHLAKPLRWRSGAPGAEATAWTVKNLFELKNARRVLAQGNLLEYNWPAAQNGFAVLLTVRNQDGGAPWSVIEDVAFTGNVVRHVGAGVNILGHDDIHPSRQTRRIAITGNLFDDVGGEWGSGRLFQVLDGTSAVSIQHNTAFNTGFVLFGGDHAPHTGFVFEHNVAVHNETGIAGSGTAPGRDSLDRYFPAASVTGNVLVGGDAARYPKGNFFPASLDGVKGHRGAGADVDALTRVAARVASPSARVEPASPQAASTDTASELWLPMEPRTGAMLVFWMSLFLIGYTYAGYPFLAWLRARLFPHRDGRAAIEPTVTIILVAHNEETCIESRIENLLALDYPADRRQILVGSDGSTDDTVARAKRFAHDGVHVVGFRHWRGKAAVLNQLVRRARGEIVLFADARQSFDPQVLRRLVARFADEQVGAVSGELMLTDSTGTPMGRGASFYWRYEKFIRVQEGRAGSTVGATGAIYAIRRALFRAIPNDTILDDVLIPMRIVQQGYLVQFEQEARAYQAVSRTTEQEYARKVRTIAGAFQLFAREWWLLSPWRNALWFETVSHKGLRLLLPVFHLALFAASVQLAQLPFYLAVVALQTAFYSAAILGHERRHAARRAIYISVPYAMCCMLWATMAAFHRFVTDRQHATWEQTPAFELPRRSTPTR
jgi:cellulose synthase/poly-beta-1,6-N-acetylglucosamine synthase-like glycosyltransferase